MKKELLIIKKEKNIKNLVFVVGIQNNKDISAMLKIINPLVSAVIFTKSGNEKAANPRELMKIFNLINKNNKKIMKMITNPRKALKSAKKITGKNDLAVVAGSLYLIGEVI